MATVLRQQREIRSSLSISGFNHAASSYLWHGAPGKYLTIAGLCMIDPVLFSVRCQVRLEINLASARLPTKRCERLIAF